MKKFNLLTLLGILFFGQIWANPTDNPKNSSYKIVVEGFDWGPAVNKVILSLDERIKTTTSTDFKVFVKRKSDAGEIPAEQASGTRDILQAFVSDENGKRVEEGSNITLLLSIAPGMPLASPFQYFRGKGNKWVDYQLTIVNTQTQQIWNQNKGKIMPLIDSFDLSGKYRHSDQLTMSYATFSPKTDKDKSPLIIWLHGGGEGGTDPTIALLGNKAANYASEEIQMLFDGAFVLVPQCPGAWMHNAQAQITHGKENDVYNEGLLALIKEYVKSNPKVDISRIYVGGCSNGGYMALKLILMDPSYFAAGYISALAYQSQYISDEEMKKIKDVPMWFVHAKDDKTTIPDLTVVPVYNRLKAMSAKNVYFTYYDNVYDITNLYGGKSFQYNGHWSWVYLHENKCRTDLDGNPVKINGKSVSIMEWMAAQSKTPTTSSKSKK